MTSPSDSSISGSAQTFEAMLKSARLTASGWTITFQVHPDEIPSEILSGQSRPGARFQVVAVPIGDDELPILGSQLHPQEPCAKASKDAVSIAGQVCRLKDFQTWIASKVVANDEPLNEEGTASLLRLALGVESRRELRTNPEVRERLYDLIDSWRRETGKLDGLNLK